MKLLLMRLFPPIALMALMLFVMACGSSSKDSAEPEPGGSSVAEPTRTEPTAASIDGADVVGQWQLDRGTLDGAAFPIVEGYRITVTLEADGTFGGTAACNGYGGRYSLEGPSLILDEVSITEMGCEPAVMTSEAAFVDVLGRSVELERRGDELVLTADDAELIFSPVQPVPTVDLVGTTWILDTIISGETASSVQGEPTLLLTDGGTLIATTGCRDLTGRYLLQGDQLLLPELSADGDCPESLRGQDNAVVSVLEGPQVDVDADRLTLTAAGGDALGYRAAPS